MTEYALRLANDADTAPRVRVGDAFSLTPGSDSDRLAARTGVRPGGGGAVSVAAGTMGVSVAAFSGWIDGGSSTAQAGYLVALDAAKTVTLADGHASLARVDTIAMVVRENTFDGSGSTDCTVTVVQGTPGGGAPTLPATCLPLRNVNVPAGLSTGTGGLSSGNLGADRRTYTTALGGILPVGSATERDGLAGKYAGLTVYRTDTGQLQTYNGAGWDSSAGADTGWVTLGILGDGDGLGTHSSLARVRRIGNRVTLDIVGASLVDIAGSGNIADRSWFTLPAGFRPSAGQFTAYVTTKAGGTCFINTTGAVSLRTLVAPGIDAGDNVWLSHTFLTD